MSRLSFEWDERKNRLNQKKHGISFEEAQTVFFDEQAMEYFDPDHSYQEQRFLMLGRRVLLVCFCYRKEKDLIRIISARKATKPEQRIYCE